MFWTKKPDPNPLGVALGDLLLSLQPTSIKGGLEGSVLVARHEHYSVRVEVIPPERRDSEDGPIQAVVQIKSELPRQLAAYFKRPESTTALNRYAAVGALTVDHAAVYVGSRLTIYEAENAWSTLHLPLLMFATICGSEAIFGALRRITMNKEFEGGVSEWTKGDFERVQTHLSRQCVCTTGGLGLTAEFGLSDGAVSAAAGDHDTALFQLMAEQPHPELGGGLLCLLQMPHRLSDSGHLEQVCAQLNNMEMAAQDLPPHFGAWCEGRIGNNPAYVSFFPNAVHSAVPGIALNAACWAMNRAMWANTALASLGVRP